MIQMLTTFLIFLKLFPFALFWLGTLFTGLCLILKLHRYGFRGQYSSYILQFESVRSEWQRFTDIVTRIYSGPCLESYSALRIPIVKWIKRY